MRVLPGPTKSNSVLAWSPDGRFVVAGGTGDGVFVWDVDAGTPGARVLSAGHGGEALRFCRATGRLYVAFRTGGVWTFDPHTSEERQHWPYEFTVNHFSPALSYDGRTLVFRRSTYNSAPTTYAVVGFAVDDDGSLREMWSRHDTGWSAPGRLDLTFRGGTDQLFSGHCSSGGDGQFEWVIASTGKLVGAMELMPRTFISQWALAPDGNSVAWFSSHALHVQRLDETGARVLPAAQDEFRRGLAWSPDSRTLAFASGRLVKLIDADTLAELRAFDWGTGKPRAVVFSPDGLRAAVSGDAGRGWVTVFDLE